MNSTIRWLRLVLPITAAVAAALMVMAATAALLDAQPPSETVAARTR